VTDVLIVMELVGADDPEILLDLTLPHVSCLKKEYK